MSLLILAREPMDDDARREFCYANHFYKIERTNKAELRVMSPAGGGAGNRNAEIIAQLRNFGPGNRPE